MEMNSRARKHGQTSVEIINATINFAISTLDKCIASGNQITISDQIYPFM